MVETDITGYKYDDAELNHSHGYLMPAIIETLKNSGFEQGQKRLFELGCGNGTVAHELSSRAVLVYSESGWSSQGY